MNRPPRSWHPLWWLPIAVIVVLAWVNATMPDDEPAARCGIWLPEPTATMRPCWPVWRAVIPDHDRPSLFLIVEQHRG